MKILDIQTKHFDRSRGWDKKNSSRLFTHFFVRQQKGSFRRSPLCLFLFFQVRRRLQRGPDFWPSPELLIVWLVVSHQFLCRETGNCLTTWISILRCTSPSLIPATSKASAATRSCSAFRCRRWSTRTSRPTSTTSPAATTSPTWRV